MKPQLSFGAFVANRFGPKWVYAHRASERIRRQYPDSTVITPKHQLELKRDYKREWGNEYDPEHWAMLCALRAVQNSSVHAVMSGDLRREIADAIALATGTKD